MRRLRNAGMLAPEQTGCFIKPKPDEELYDVESDPHELHNLAFDGRHAETLKSLRAELEKWQRDTSDPIPGLRNPDEFDRETGEPLPKAMLDKLLAAKNYQAALFILRQLEFGLFDFRMHFEYSPEKGAQILPTLAEVKKMVAVVPSPSWGRFPHAFSHIFAGGYAAGYYSYLWAEVLSADAYSRFEEEGIFNAETGKSFLDNILSRGGSEEPMALFKRFRGREPQLDAMLRHYGIKG